MTRRVGAPNLLSRFVLPLAPATCVWCLDWGWYLEPIGNIMVPVQCHCSTKDDDGLEADDRLI